MSEFDADEFREHAGGGRALRMAAIVGALALFVVSAVAVMGASPAPSTGANGPTGGASQAPAATTGPDTRGGPPGFFRGPGILRGLGNAFGLGSGGGPSIGPFGGPGLFGDISITAIDGSSLTLKTDDGWTRTITVADTTKIDRDGTAITLADLKVGDHIRFRETRQDDGTFVIDRIEVVVPRIGGVVTGVSADSFTIKGRAGITTTVTTSASTVYRLGGGSGSRADLTVGSSVVVSGTPGSGPSFSATDVTIVPPTAFGTVTAKTGSTLTLKRLNGTTITVDISTDTKIHVRGKDAGTLADVAVGDRVVAVGPQGSDGTIRATDVYAGKLGRGMFGGRLDEGDGMPNAAPGGSPTVSTQG